MKRLRLIVLRLAGIGLCSLFCRAAWANNPPTATWISPTDQAMLPAITTWSLTVQVIPDTSTYIANISFYDNGVNIGDYVNYCHPPFCVVSVNNDYSVTNLPITSPVTGEHQLTAVATDDTGIQSSSAIIHVEISTDPVISINSCEPPNGPQVLGSPFTSYCTVYGGTQPFSYSLTGLPGISVFSHNSDDAMITGTPTLAGPYTMAINVTDNATPPQVYSYYESNVIYSSPTITFNPPALSFTSIQGSSTPLPSQSLSVVTANPSHLFLYQIATAYGPDCQWLSANWSGAVNVGAPYSYNLSADPVGLSTGAYVCNIGFGNDYTHVMQSVQATLYVDAPLVVTSTGLPQGTVGQAYSAALQASGGTPPYGWSVSSGTLPTGLSISTGGVISGTPTLAGTSNFTAQVVDAASESAQAAFSITLAGGVTLVLPTPDLSSIPAQLPVNATITTRYPSGLASQFQWSFQVQGSPAAIQFLSPTPSLDLSLLPLAPGIYVITLQASAGTIVSAPISTSVVLVLPPPVLNLSAATPLDADITLGIPAGITFARFEWSITPAQPGAGGASASVVIARAASAAFSTQASKANAQAENLVPGYYSVSVTAYDGNGNPSLPAQAFTTFVAMDLGSVGVHPSPWRSDRGWPEQVTFDNLPQGSSIKIFTISGKWVKTISNASGQAAWDLKNDEGSPVASGLYLYLVTDGQGNKTHGKFGVIR